MSITLFGTCRINGIPNHNNLNNLITYTHSTKEVIQFIKLLKGEIKIPSPYNRFCFRTGIINNTNIECSNKYNELFNNSNICVIEICSKKKYIHKDFYLHHLAIDKIYGHTHRTYSEIKDNYVKEIQSDEEIENDILEIRKMLYPKKIVIISHYNSILNGDHIKSRDVLINLLNHLCTKYNIPFVNPSDVLSNFTQEQVMQTDLGHYTKFGLKEFSNNMDNYLKSL